MEYISTPKVTQRLAKDQLVITTSNGDYFQSYGTLIAHRNLGGRITLDAHYWDYSKTTTKWRNRFTELTTNETSQGINEGIIQLRDLNQIYDRVNVRGDYEGSRSKTRF
jgi:hypothetical protein